MRSRVRVSSPFRVVVAGGRDYSDAEKVHAVLDRLHPTEIIHGGCPSGVDCYAQAWADYNQVPVQVFEADWATHGRAAGPIRNRSMLDQSRPDLVLIFPGGRGTLSCKEIAFSLRCRVVVID